jgi:hypothetical protein
MSGVAHGRYQNACSPGVTRGATRFAQRHSSGRVSRGSTISSISKCSAERNGERTRSSRSRIAARWAS